MARAVSLSIQPASVSVRRYAGEYDAHTHPYAQVLFGLGGRLELEIGGRQAFVDSSCGVIIPAGLAHGFMAASSVRLVVVDAPSQAGLDRYKRFALSPVCNGLGTLREAEHALHVAILAQRILTRRGLDLARLACMLDQTLHTSWSTAKMAAVFFLSPQRFHARLLELTGLTPQQYLRNRRFCRAMEFLRSGRTLEDTALQVGYRSGSALAFGMERDCGLSARRLRHADGATA